MADYFLRNTKNLAALFASGLFTVEVDEEDEDTVEFSPQMQWQKDDAGKWQRSTTQATFRGVPLWELAVRTRTLRFGKSQRQDDRLIVAAQTPPSLLDDAGYGGLSG